MRKITKTNESIKLVKLCFIIIIIAYLNLSLTHV